MTLTATIAGATGGTVTFYDGATSLVTVPVSAGGVATTTVSTMAASPSPHSLTAAFSGDGTLDPSTSTAIGHTVAKAATSINLSSSGVTTLFGQPVTFTATVAAQAPATATPNGSVTFYDGVSFTTIGSAPLNGSGVAALTISTLAVGVHSIAAEYTGNTNFDNVTTSGFSHTVILNRLRFVPITPCRISDTRNTNGPFGGPAMAANVSRDYIIPASACNIPTTALAYSLNVTVVPLGSLGYLSLWPAGQPQPVVSTLNSLDGRIKANAAIIPAGNNGAVSVLVTNPSHLILDINGYFVSAIASENLSFYAIPPCRLSDTRNAPGTFGGPSLAAGVERSYPVRSGPCGVPVAAQAYALNVTVVPKGSLGYLTTWPTGQNIPLVSTLNAPTGTVTANMAIVPAGSGGAISVFATQTTDLVIDITGYFAPPGAFGSMDFYATVPCRVSDTRNPTGPLGGPAMAAQETRSFVVPLSPCAISGSAKAYSLNATVLPQPTLGYLTLWGGGQQPIVSTLNAPDGTIVSNAALVPAGVSGEVTAFTTNASHLILDINGYFQ